MKALESVHEILCVNIEMKPFESLDENPNVRIFECVNIQMMLNDL